MNQELVASRKKLEKASQPMDSEQIRDNRNNRGLAGQERSKEEEASPWRAIQNNGAVLVSQWAKEEAEPPLRAKLLAEELDGSAELRMGGEKINSSGAATHSNCPRESAALPRNSTSGPSCQWMK